METVLREAIHPGYLFPPPFGTLPRPHVETHILAPVEAPKLPLSTFSATLNSPLPCIGSTEARLPKISKSMALLKEGILGSNSLKAVLNGMFLLLLLGAASFTATTWLMVSSLKEEIKGKRSEEAFRVEVLEKDIGKLTTVIRYLVDSWKEGTDLVVKEVSYSGSKVAYETSAPKASPNPISQVAEVVVQKANLREGPGANYKPIMVLARGSKLAVIERNGAWVNVWAPNGVPLWISKEVVALNIQGGQPWER